MTDKIKERLYEISHYKYFHLVSLIIICILMGLTYVLDTIIDTPIHLTLYISVISVLLFFIIKSFKQYNLKIIKKNKLITIILSDEDCVTIPLCLLYGFIITLIVANNVSLHFALLMFLILLGLVIVFLLSTKIKNYYKKRIIK